MPGVRLNKDDNTIFKLLASNDDVAGYVTGNMAVVAKVNLSATCKYWRKTVTGVYHQDRPAVITWKINPYNDPNGTQAMPRVAYFLSVWRFSTIVIRDWCDQNNTCMLIGLSKNGVYIKTIVFDTSFFRIACNHTDIGVPFLAMCKSLKSVVFVGERGWWGETGQVTQTERMKNQHLLLSKNGVEIIVRELNGVPFSNL